MGYAAITLGILGMLGCYLIYLKVDYRSFWYEAGLLGYIASWLLWTYGMWQVLA